MAEQFMTRRERAPFAMQGVAGQLHDWMTTVATPGSPGAAAQAIDAGNIQIQRVGRLAALEQDLMDARNKMSEHSMGMQQATHEDSMAMSREHLHESFKNDWLDETARTVTFGKLVGMKLYDKTEGKEGFLGDVNKFLSKIPGVSTENAGVKALTQQFMQAMDQNDAHTTAALASLAAVTENLNRWMSDAAEYVDKGTEEGDMFDMSYREIMKMLIEAGQEVY